MKFRGKIVELMFIQHFIKIIGTLSRLTKVIVLRITPTKLNFVYNTMMTTGGVSIWCELNQGNYFNEYNMEGVSSDDNEIYLEFIPENLAKALKVAQNAKSLKIKLTKKHAPCLTVEIELPSLTIRSRNVTHDVPVTVIPRRLWNEYKEPTMPQFDLSFYMPAIKIVKNVADRMKNLSNFILIKLNDKGEMALKVETDEVTASTHFKDLIKPTLDDGDYQTNNDVSEAEVRLDIRKLTHFLSGQQINPARLICSMYNVVLMFVQKNFLQNIVNNRMVQFFMLHDDMSLQYFISGVSA
ncbi:Checkpoint protein HUS1 [Nymphon striatum]|nr:Checkpoint protein HUS1 [Nymphon striatum]